MDGSKLNGILQSFTRHDDALFKQYLQSPFFNKDKQVLPLYNIITSNKVKPSNKQLLYKKAFKKTDFNDKHWRYLTSALCTHAENFLAWRYFQNNQKEILLAKATILAQRDCEKAYDYTYIDINRHINATTHEAEHYQFVFSALNTHIGYMAQKQKRKYKLPFDDAMHNLDCYYVAKKIQLYCDMLNAQNILSGDFKVTLLDEIKQLIHKKHFRQVPAVEIYYTIMLTLTEPEDEKHFDALKELLHTKAQLFPPLEQRDLYQYLKNYCIKKINQGSREYVRTLFNTYKEILANKKIMNVDFFSQWEYKNVVTIALRLGEKAWAKNFIEGYNVYLQPAERKNAFTYNMANWYFFEKRYNMVLKLLQEVEFTDLYYQLDSKSILLKTYYEQGDEEMFLFHVGAFKIFLKRNKTISEYQRKIFNNLIKYTLKLLRAGGRSLKVKTVNAEIKTVKQIADLGWLEEKIREQLMP